MARSWYGYIGGPTGDPRLASDYTIITGKPACITGPNVCAIYAPGLDLSPNAPLSTNMLLYISNARVSGVPEPQSPTGTKRYVYLRA